MGFQLSIAQSLNSLREIARLKQDDTQAEIHYCRSLHIARELGVKELASVELHNLGYVAVHSQPEGNMTHQSKMNAAIELRHVR